jgi:hypothetical protein
MKKLLIALTMLALPSLTFAGDFTVAELLQGITDPHVVAGASYNETTKKWSAVLTANIVGPKLGTIPCYISGVGVGLNTLAPGLEGTPIAAVSLPFLTCAPFGEQVAVQVGMATPMNGGDNVGTTYYFGVGISIGGGPAQLQSKRIKRIQAKAAKKAMLDQGPPAPVS